MRWGKSFLKLRELSTHTNLTLSLQTLGARVEFLTYYCKLNNTALKAIQPCLSGHLSL